MAMSIVPGHDFGAFDVPTQALLFQMTAGMSISGIDRSQINVSLIGQLATSSTGYTLSTEGFLNYDQHGRLWVTSRWGTVMLWRGNWGGWETNRYMAGNPVDAFTFPAPSFQAIGMLRTPLAGGTLESNVFWRPGSQSPIHPMPNAETGVSGAQARIVGRGGSFGSVLTTDRAPLNDRAGGSPDYLRRNTAAQVTANISGFPANALSTNATSRKRGFALRMPSTTCIMWFVGTECMQD